MDQSWFRNSYLFLCSYGLVVILPISILQNFFALLILCRMRKGIGSTTRRLFVMLSIFDLFNLLFYYGLGIFADYGIGFLTSDRISIDFVNTNQIACKLTRSGSHFGIFLLNWTYFLVNVERLVAVRMPQRAKRWCRSKNILFCIFLIFIFGILCSAPTAYVYNVKQSPVAKAGKTFCGADTTDRFAWIAVRLLLAASTYVGPNMISLVLAFLLLYYIWKRVYRPRTQQNQINIIHRRVCFCQPVFAQQVSNYFSFN